MTEVVVSKVTAGTSPDEITVEGTVDGESVTATGWKSAMERHYLPSAYLSKPLTATDDDGVSHVVAGVGDLRPDAKPRAMTKRERMAYWESLLVPALTPAAPAEPEVLFEAGTAK